MKDETLFQRGTTFVRRLQLATGEAMPWHRDPFHRVTVILNGIALAIEYRDGSESQRFEVTPRQVDWDEPTDRVHRGVNVGKDPYEEITIFFLDHPDDVPQPKEEQPAATSATYLYLRGELKEVYENASITSWCGIDFGGHRLQPVSDLSKPYRDGHSHIHKSACYSHSNPHSRARHADAYINT